MELSFRTRMLRQVFSLPLSDIEDIVEHNQDVIVIVDEAYVDFGTQSALL